MVYSFIHGRRIMLTSENLEVVPFGIYLFFEMLNLPYIMNGLPMQRLLPWCSPSSMGDLWCQPWQILGPSLLRGARTSLHGRRFIHAEASPMVFSFIHGRLMMSTLENLGKYLLPGAYASLHSRCFIREEAYINLGEFGSSPIWNPPLFEVLMLLYVVDSSFM